MLANYFAASERCKADIAFPALTGNTIPPPRGNIIEVNPPAFGSGFTETNGRTRRGVDFMFVMHLDDFNIVVVIKRSGELFGKRKQYINANGKIHGFDNGDILSRSFNRRQSICIMARGAYHQSCLVLFCELEMILGCRRQGKVNDYIRAGK